MNRLQNLLCLLLVLACAQGAIAQARSFGLGFMVGDPTGLNMKYFLDTKHAIDVGLGWGNGYWGDRRYRYYTGDDRCYDPGYYNANRDECRRRYAYGDYDRSRSFHLHMDYLFHNYNVIRAKHPFPIYYGPGLRLNMWDYHHPYYGREWDSEFGIRMVIGLAFMPRNAPFDLFFELAPVLNLIPNTRFKPEVGLGARFWF